MKTFTIHCGTRSAPGAALILLDPLAISLTFRNARQLCGTSTNGMWSKLATDRMELKGIRKMGAWPITCITNVVITRQEVSVHVFGVRFLA